MSSSCLSNLSAISSNTFSIFAITFALIEVRFEAIAGIKECQTTKWVKAIILIRRGWCIWKFSSIGRWISAVSLCSFEAGHCAIPISLYRLRRGEKHEKREVMHALMVMGTSFAQLHCGVRELGFS